MSALPNTPTLSHWQLGCEDAKAGRAPRRPFPNAEALRRYDEVRANEGYMNGHRYGLGQRYEPSENEGSEP